jgi:hypothetical protein
MDVLASLGTNATLPPPEMNPAQFVRQWYRLRGFERRST